MKAASPGEDWYWSGPQRVVDAATGEVAQRLDYDSFGRVVRDTNPGFQPFGFQCGLYDPDTGLVEFGCRWYDAQTGRWISKDPILLDGGWNVYAFCDNDPREPNRPVGRGFYESHVCHIGFLCRFWRHSHFWRHKGISRRCLSRSWIA